MHRAEIDLSPMKAGINFTLFIAIVKSLAWSFSY